MRIVVPLRSSTLEAPVVKTGVNLAEKTGAEVTFIYVVDLRPIRGYMKFPKSLIEHFRREGNKALNRAVKLAEERGINVNSILTEGYPHEEIIEAIEDADLLITKTRVFSPEGVLGDVAEKILKKSPTPVMLVNREQKNFEKCLVPVDGSKHAERALKYLMKYQDTFRFKEIHIVYVATLSEREREGREILENAMQTIKKIEGKIEPHLRKGKESYISNEILKVCREKNLDVIVMGQTGKGAIKRFFVGSVSRAVSLESPIPVILVS